MYIYIYSWPMRAWPIRARPVRARPIRARPIRAWPLRARRVEVRVHMYVLCSLNPPLLVMGGVIYNPPHCYYHISLYISTPHGSCLSCTLLREIPGPGGSFLIWAAFL